MSASLGSGAGDGLRTRYLNLGKFLFHHGGCLIIKSNWTEAFLFQAWFNSALP